MANAELEEKNWKRNEDKNLMNIANIKTVYVIESNSACSST